MVKQNLALSEVYKMLEPGPVVLVTTAYGDRQNVMPMSWQTMLDFEPPIFCAVISNRNYSFELLKKSKQCVVNIPGAELAPIVVKCGNISGEKIDKFNKLGLTPLPASLVNAPLIKECFVNLECRVINTRMVNLYNLFIFEVVKAWIEPSKKRHLTLHHCGRGVFVIDGKLIKLPFNKK